MGVRPTIGSLSIPEAQALAVGLVRINLAQFRAGLPSVSAGLRSGRLRYIPSDPTERWLTAREVWRNGGGDCEDLAAALAAERTLAGQPARVVFIKIGPSDWHAVTEICKTGQREDPSQTGGYRP